MQGLCLTHVNKKVQKGFGALEPAATAEAILASILYDTVVALVISLGPQYPQS